MHSNVTCINLILCGVDRLPLEIRSSATDLQCNQVVLPAWLCQKTQSFFHILWVFLHLARWAWSMKMSRLSPCLGQTLTISLRLFADDHLLLLCSSLQWQVFEEENRAAVRLLAGDNVEISRSLDPCSFNQFIPVNNFLHCRSQKTVTVLQYFKNTDEHSCINI